MKLELSESLMLLLMYYRCYITQEFLGYLFGLDDSNVCRLIQRLEPFLEGLVKVRKEKVLKKGEVEALIIDASEHPIERPKIDQKLYYSGKKKRHTLKTEMRCTLDGEILQLSENYPGSVHDFSLYKQEIPVDSNVHAYADSGYQGLDKLHQSTEIPYKKSKNHQLDEEEKEYNTALSIVRVVIEHVWGDIKTFRIMKDVYRNRRKRYAEKLPIIAGLVNIKNGFAI